MFRSFQAITVGSICTFILLTAACSASSSQTGGTSTTATPTVQATATLMPPTPTRVKPTPTKVPPTPTAPPVNNGPPQIDINPQTTNGFCGTSSQFGNYPPVTITNSGGGTLKWYYDIPGQPIKLNQHFKLAVVVNGGTFLGQGTYTLGAGQSATLQLNQNSLTASNNTSFGSNAPQSAVTGSFAQVLVTDTLNPYISYQIRFFCTNY